MLPEPIVMIRIPRWRSVRARPRRGRLCAARPAAASRLARILVLAAIVALGACKKSNESEAAPQHSTVAGGPSAPAQSAEELKTPLATIDDITITIGEFQERINRQSPYIRARYTSIEQKREFLDSLVRFEVLAKEA